MARAGASEARAALASACLGAGRPLEALDALAPLSPPSAAGRDVEHCAWVALLPQLRPRTPGLALGDRVRPTAVVGCLADRFLALRVMTPESQLGAAHRLWVIDLEAWAGVVDPFGLGAAAPVAVTPTGVHCTDEIAPGTFVSLTAGRGLGRTVDPDAFVLSPGEPWARRATPFEGACLEVDPSGAYALVRRQVAPEPQRTTLRVVELSTGRTVRDVQVCDEIGGLLRAAAALRGARVDWRRPAGDVHAVVSGVAAASFRAIRTAERRVPPFTLDLAAEVLREFGEPCP